MEAPIHRTIVVGAGMPGRAGMPGTARLAAALAKVHVEPQAKPGMLVRSGYPPNISKIRAAFPVIVGAPVLFCYGTTIFASPGAVCPAHKIAHETIHMTRQGDDVDGWWDRYIADADFRFNEEALAYVAEYLFLCEKEPGRGARRRNLVNVAAALASPLYGRLISKTEAKQFILDCASAAKRPAGE